jgi:hypothetical protein
MMQWALFGAILGCMALLAMAILAFVLIIRYTTRRRTPTLR